MFFLIKLLLLVLLLGLLTLWGTVDYLTQQKGVTPRDNWNHLVAWFNRAPSEVLRHYAAFCLAILFYLVISRIVL